MIAIENLTVAFGAVRPLDQLDARMTAPIVGLIGPNGAGKTTLLNVFSGFITPRSGRVRVDDLSLLELSPVERVRRGLRRMFQQEMIVHDLSAADNIRAIADHVSPRTRARAEVELAMDFVGIHARRNIPGRRLSLFERRLVELAKTLVGSPRIILLDEPAAGLNDAETATLRDLVSKIPDAFGARLIWIDHDADLIASTCEETLVLDFGRRLAVGPTRAVLEDPVVRQAYLGKA